MTVPSEERYRELIGVLRENTKLLNSAKDDDKAQLALGLGALRAVVLYLQGDVEVLDGFLTRPLAVIENAAYDAGQGATVALLEHPPTRPGKPTDLVREQVQGVMAFAVDLLIASDMGKERAVDWVASEARQLHVRSEDGAPIVARQIGSWRSEIRRGKAPARARETSEGLRCLPKHAALLKGPHSVTKRERCEIFARVLIKSLAAIAPQSAPKQTRRLKQ